MHSRCSRRPHPDGAVDDGDAHARVSDGPGQRTPAGDGGVGEVLASVSRGRVAGAGEGGRPTGGSRHHPRDLLVRCASILPRRRPSEGGRTRRFAQRIPRRLRFPPHPSCRRNRNRRKVICPRTSDHSAMPRTPCASASLVLALLRPTSPTRPQLLGHQTARRAPR